MKKIMSLVLLVTLTFLLVSCDDEPEPIIEEKVCLAPSDYSSSLTYNLVWSDEFDGDTLNEDNWKYEINGSGGGNNELQYYTDQNVTVSEGTLKITAKKEAYMSRDYTSSRITTEYHQTFKYGVIEISAKIPAGKGTWPALWMMPEFSRYGGWPNSGEIDIMEHVGYDPNVIHGTVHTDYYNHKDGSSKGGTTRDYQDVTEEFHVYKIEWLPDQIKWYVDDELYYTFNPNKFSSCPTYKAWPFISPFFLIFNVAVGGDWGGAQGIDDDIFPTTMEVDYVRVYQAEELEEYDDNSQ